MCACSSSERTTAPAASPSGGFAHGNVLIDTSEGSVLVKIEIADSEQERELGLMNRTSLAENAGMMFIFMEPVKTGFWMKDTKIPLSIAFINDNFDIVSILDMDPCEAAPCKVYTPESAYSAALEVNQGAFEKWGVRVGDRVTLTRS
jgi:uncharacterized membrane protein (UPF0127 family)